MEIRSGIPMPDKQSSRHTDLRRLFTDMEVMDSFVFPDDKMGSETFVRSAAFRYGKQLERKYSVRRIDEVTLGIWRTE